MATEWLTWECPNRPSGTCQVGERIQLGIGFQSRPATTEEIKVEIARREEALRQEKIRRDTHNQLEREFQADRTFGDAAEIASIINPEQMDYSDHPLDRLSPAEWAELRRRLTL